MLHPYFIFLLICFHERLCTNCLSKIWIPLYSLRYIPQPHTFHTCSITTLFVWLQSQQWMEKSQTHQILRKDFIKCWRSYRLWHETFLREYQSHKLCRYRISLVHKSQSKWFVIIIIIIILVKCLVTTLAMTKSKAQRFLWFSAFIGYHLS